jgi:hypothetical protein
MEESLKSGVYDDTKLNPFRSDNGMKFKPKLKVNKPSQLRRLTFSWRRVPFQLRR